MAYLTLQRIKKMVSKDGRIDPAIEVDGDTVSLWTVDGYAWDKREERHIETVRIGSYERDTVEYLKSCISGIEAE